ncbi:MAG TPA: methylenetetrahydrofolate reductase [NAD(P)H] [Peptococcaceae bacterium]|jgi:methylenetetrahydrofolate reductase (NADPH)|nr:methylenetetrahydrofolate reductase [NAD(P)H] [Clostridia bacterium]HOB81946.1 methylenetetrahydrofolate reductase [NAD(P)H] [Peptococcaceae bacterium]HPZ71390.1 methylenetetrahydrofolate reductase [NAD(P)H] [Peptococcaceae bacterium]HQD53264.1 methylenetetrahydrofolate reductase [NAD(P)H] [Peptococcaceae bacterium]
MYLKDLFARKKGATLSFEIFPPKKNMPMDTIFTTIEGLSNLKPDFISVTYGAGGSSKDRTVEIASHIKQKHGIEALAHLTCISSTKEEIEGIVAKLQENQIENILALRGDLPQDPSFVFPTPLHYRYASDLIYQLKQKKAFCIGAACYPEGHVECISLEKDIEYLKIKVNAGTDFLITQLFYDNEMFYKFMDKIRKTGVNIPVLAGIMPMLSKKQIERCLSFSNTALPNKFTRLLEKYGDNTELLTEAGIYYATEQIIDLLAWGVDGIHIYTMNRPEIARRITENITPFRRMLQK